jgi:4-hydroxy-tetrahydrodipicolinate reductase
MKVAIIGYGKMGKAIETILLQKGHTIPLKINIENQHDLTTAALQLCDVAIEFTGAESAQQNITACLLAGIPIISGSTGWLQNFEQVKNYCTLQNGTLLYASNFSIGVNIFFEINTLLAKLMASQPQYSIEVEEIHHTAKKDAPSGTAISIAEQIMQINRLKSSWINSDGITNASELPIISKRIDPAPGTHTVTYSCDIDTIEIKHTAHNRVGFASGAVLAAEFIVHKKGIFSMKDVLGIS